MVQARADGYPDLLSRTPVVAAAESPAGVGAPVAIATPQTPAASLQAGSQRPGAPELVLEGERSINQGWGPCEAAPPGLRWRLPSGELLPVRCGRSNSCPKCAWLAAIENVAVVALDARVSQPRVGMTLTTRDPNFDAGRYRRAVRAIFQWLRRTYGSQVAYLLMMEWTTGTGGHGRLPHSHLLVKGLPDNLDLSPGCDLWRELKARWEHETGAWRVELRELRSAGGAIAYMVGHHHKGEQAPPEGWSGKRFRPSQNYFATPIADLRIQARAERKRAIALLTLAQERGDVMLELAADVVEQLVDEYSADSEAELVRVQEVPVGFGADGLPAEWALEVVGPAHG
jgi:hypothetical protein